MFLSLKHLMPRSFLSQNMSVNVLVFRGVVTMLTCTIYMGRKCFKPREANIRPGGHAGSHRVTKTALNCSFKRHLASRFHFRSNCMSLVHSASAFRGSACAQSYHPSSQLFSRERNGAIEESTTTHTYSPWLEALTDRKYYS